jgi:hypothetical protein
VPGTAMMTTAMTFVLEEVDAYRPMRLFWERDASTNYGASTPG